MNFAEFVGRFSERQEIGRDVTGQELRVFFDNGQEVGVWRQDRGTTIGQGEVLGSEDAEMARHWCRRQLAERGRGDGPTEPTR